MVVVILPLLVDALSEACGLWLVPEGTSNARDGEDDEGDDDEEEEAEEEEDEEEEEVGEEEEVEV